MEPESSEQLVGAVTQILRRLESGDADARGDLLASLQTELRKLAQLAFRRAHESGHTLQPTALVNEAFLKVFGGDGTTSFRDRTHFLAHTACAMRSILVDHARKKRTGKRGDDPQQVEFDTVLVQYEDRSADIVDLNEALEHLAALEPDAARVVVLRFFGGLEYAEIAEELDWPISRVEKNIRLARAWLLRELDPRRERPDA